MTSIPIVLAVLLIVTFALAIFRSEFKLVYEILLLLSVLFLLLGLAG